MADTLVGRSPIVRTAVVRIPAVAGNVSDCSWRDPVHFEVVGTARIYRHHKVGEEPLHSFLCEYRQYCGWVQRRVPFG